MRKMLGRAICTLAVLVLSAYSLLPASVYASASGNYPSKTGNASLFYAVIVVFSFFLVAAYLLWEKPRDIKFLALYSCVAIANLGYFLLSASKSLPAALWANRIGYFGSAYAVLTMVLIVAEVCHIRLKSWTKIVLISITSAAFLLASTGGWLNIYYSAVSLEIINGVSHLVKSYAPLHVLYTVYILFYFALMVILIIRARRNKLLSSTKYAMFLAAVVLGNIAVWGVEQFINIDFEFLSISYIATELFLLLFRGVMKEYEKHVFDENMLRNSLLEQSRHSATSDHDLPPNIEELFIDFTKRVDTLTPTEHMMLQYYIDGLSLEEIAQKSYISINTAKKHNTNLNRKLELKNREELLVYIDLFRRVGRLEDITYSR